MVVASLAPVIFSSNYLRRFLTSSKYFILIALVINSSLLQIIHCQSTNEQGDKDRSTNHDSISKLPSSGSASYKFLSVGDDYDNPMDKIRFYSNENFGFSSNIPTSPTAEGSFDNSKSNSRNTASESDPSESLDYGDTMDYSVIDSDGMLGDPPPGEFGNGVFFEDYTYSVQQEITESYSKYGFNKYVSDLVPYNRTLLDYRNSRCQAQSSNMKKDLPKASVIVTFHNEPISTLKRTLYSIVDRSSENFLREIILINDFSHYSVKEEEELKFERLFPNTDIKLIRTFEQEGVARARTLGAVNAKGPVLIFLDSHVEVTEGWLEPLLERISINPKAVVAPTVDVIDADSFQFKASNVSMLRVGMFDWKLQIKWKRARDALLKAKSSPTDPVQSAVIPFGMFAIRKSFFKSLGYFDTEFQKWGGEALELSFKTWLCGGRVEISPCSHVGHLFKGEQPKDHANSMTTNLQRLAASWMGPYAKFFYAATTPGEEYYGNVSSRLQIGLNLNCKPFSWYLENVSPEVFNPDLSVGEGEISNRAFESHKCLDAGTKEESVGKQGRVWPCHYWGWGGNQYWHYSNYGELRRIDLCLDYSSKSQVIMYYCQRMSKSQKWRYEFATQLMHHPLTSKCLTIDFYENLYLDDCDPKEIAQKWNIQYLYADRLTNLVEKYFNHTDSIT